MQIKPFDQITFYTALCDLGNGILTLQTQQNFPVNTVKRLNVATGTAQFL